MPSPFPGMNPYLERAGVWEEFHHHFITHAQAALVPQVRPQYYVRSEPTLYIHAPSADERRLFGKAELGLTHGTALGAGAPAALAAPVYGSFPVMVTTEELFRIEIRDRAGHGLVTVIELLSPSNKYAGEDREKYCAKRAEVLKSMSHFVELDLLRGGPRLPLLGLPPCHYHALVSRMEDRSQVGIWPWTVREPMPTIPIPLRGDDPPARLDLKAVLDRVYDEQGYADYIYAGPPEPKLNADDAAWAAGFLPPGP